MLAVAALGGCAGPSADAEPTKGERTTSTTAPADEATAVTVDPAAPKPAPRPTIEAALTDLLDAERAGDRTTSYALLSDAGRRAYPSLRAWAERRAELPAITGFDVEKASGSAVVALVRHDPGLDPFVGLRPGRERQTWSARKVDGGFLLDAEPDMVPLFPEVSGATSVAAEWARALQSCDGGRAVALQAVDPLLGLSDAPARLCRSTGEISAARPSAVPAGPPSADLVAQYGTDALTWAKAVAITGPSRPFHLVLAPIGDSWRVVGVFEG